jgi:D-galactarolactone cycloisomerase
MRIERIEAINLCYEYPEGGRFTYAGGVCTHRVTTLVLVHAESGEVGIGSVYSHPGLAYMIVRDQLDPLLRGADPLEVEERWDEMYGLTRWYGRKGAAMSALGGVDTALWDLRGKSEGKPVWALLGGERSTCPAYASGLLWNTIEGLADQARGYIDDGFRRVKMRLARSEEYDTEAVRAVREAIGWDNDVIVDASMRYHLELARRMGRFLAEQKVFWYEEPFAPEDLDRYVALRGTVEVPIAAGENEFGLQGFRELARTGAVDIVQPDASRCGGISEVHRVGRLAQEHGLRVATHSWSDAVAIVANAHAIAAMENGLTVEVDRTGTPLVDELLSGGLQVEDGLLELGDAPGLGVELNLEIVERLRMDDPLVMPTGIYSDMVFGGARFAEPVPYAERE